MFAGIKTKHYLPWDEDAWIEFQTLTGEQIAEAKRAGLKAMMSLVSGLDADGIKAFRAAAAGSENQEADPDGATLLRYGIVSWSDESDPSPENIARLDARTFEWAVDVVLDSIRRPAGEENGSEESSGAAASLTS